jgi:hypothetical protein
MTPSAMQIVAACLFALAILHTFTAPLFSRLALTRPRHAGVWHLLSEVEVVFGFWAFVLMLILFAVEGRDAAVGYIDSCNFTEPMFVFAIMVMAGTRPILQLAKKAIFIVSALLPLPRDMGFYLTVLVVVPLMGSFITEPATMTLGALILRDRFYNRNLPPLMQYVTLAVLLVNVSIGGTLTPFAAPPVIMVAGKWQWDLAFMATTFGWKSALACLVNALAATVLFRKQFATGGRPVYKSDEKRVPFPLIVIHVLFLAGVVVFSHHPVIFVGLFLFFLGVSHAYARHQEPLLLRQGLMVAFFLSGLVVLGGKQQWWLQELLGGMTHGQVFVGATILTSFTDNAALTYMGSLVDGMTDAFKYALVAGAVTGGGLTIIANAPNPAGISILRDSFAMKSVKPLPLFLAGLLPTLVAALAFNLF